MSCTKTVLSTLLIGLLSACGGGGGGVGSDSYSIEGFAAKGTLKFATVEVYKLDTNANETLVKSTETLADGTYKITGLSSTAGQKYIIKIKPNSRTIHVDELLSEQVLPTTFVMTALTQTDASTTTASVTPFSHMVVEAAKKASGGLNDTNIKKAQSTVTEMLGFDPTSIPKNDGASVEAQKLSILLTAVSQMAKDNALNCGTTPSEKTECVVKRLGEAATTSSLKMESTVAGTTVNVSSKLAAAVNTTLAADPSKPSAILAQAINKLNCTTNCTPAVAQDATTTSAIQKVKTVFDEIRTDLTTMFSSDGVTNTSKGKANLQAFKFQQTFEGVKISTDQIVKDFDAVQSGITLYNNYKTVTGSSVTFNSKYGDFAYTSGLSNPYLYSSVACSLYQTKPIINTTVPLATANGNNANFIGCSARYSYTAVTNRATGDTTYEHYRHSFVMTPKVSGSFDYETFASKVTTSCPLNATTCTSVTQVLQKDANGNNVIHTGSINPAVKNSAGLITYSMSGDVAPGFNLVPYVAGTVGYQPVVLVRNDGKDTWNLDIQANEDPTTLELTKLTLSGSIASYNGVGFKLSEIAINKGSFIDQSTYSGVLDLSFSAGSGSNTSTLSGVLTAGTPVTDKSKNKTIPSKINFTGTLSNSTGGTAVNFLQGAIDLEIKNYDKYDVRYAQSITNTPIQSIAFTGSVTAPDQPKLEIVLSTEGKAFNLEDTAQSAQLAYNRYKDSVKNRTVTISVTNSATAYAKSVSVIEATSGLSISFVDSDKTAIVKANGVEIGTWDLSSGLMTFKDGSVVSLDIKV